jgi:hypothetical protein
MSQAKSTERREALRFPDDLKTGRRPSFMELTRGRLGLIVQVIRSDGAESHSALCTPGFASKRTDCSLA